MKRNIHINWYFFIPFLLTGPVAYYFLIYLPQYCVNAGIVYEEMLKDGLFDPVLNSTCTKFPFAESAYPLLVQVGVVLIIAYFIALLVLIFTHSGKKK